jgi:hypothetical protein
MRGVRAAADCLFHDPERQAAEILRAMRRIAGARDRGTHSITSDQLPSWRDDGGRQLRRREGLEDDAGFLSAAGASKDPQLALALGLDVSDLHVGSAAPADGSFVMVAHDSSLPEPRAADLIWMNPRPIGAAQVRKLDRQGLMEVCVRTWCIPRSRRDVGAG